MNSGQNLSWKLKKLAIIMMPDNIRLHGNEAARAVADPDYRVFSPVLIPASDIPGSAAWKDIREPVRTDGLILCDAPLLAENLLAAGYPVVGYFHEGNAGAKFPGLSYVLSEIDNVDLDTYEKIFERLHHLPWTILTTKRCIVREMCVSDLDGLYRLYDDAAAQRFLEGPGPDREKEREILASYIDRVYGLYGYGYWGVTDRESGELIGRVGFEPYRGAEEAVSFGYLIRRDYRGQGIAKEVAAAVLAFAEQNLGFPGIIVETDRENAASIALLHSLGFEKEQRAQETETDPNMTRWIRNYSGQRNL